MAEEAVIYSGPIVTLEAARNLGLPRYFTGNPCKKGHIAERAVKTFICVLCKKKWAEISRERMPGYNQEYRRKHADRLRLQRADRYARECEKAKERTREWSRANPGKKKATNAAWRRANSEWVKENAGRWARENPQARDAIQKRWRKNHPERSRAIVRRRRARKLKAGGSHAIKQIETLLAKQKYRCAGCCASIRTERHLDHIEPLSRGGSDDIRNLQWLCPKCNRDKSDMDPLAWGRKHGRLL